MTGTAMRRQGLHTSAKKPRRRSNLPGLRHLLLHAGLLALSAFCVHLTAETNWVYLSLPVYGIVLTFLFAPLHESIHYTAFRSGWLNRIVARITGLVLLLPPRYFRAFHLAHHRHTQDPAKDPELASPKPETLWAYMLYLSGFPYWLERIGTLLKHACGSVTEPFIRPALTRVIKREARVYLLFYVIAIFLSLWQQNGVILNYWLIPALLGQPFLRAFLYAEHSNCPLTDNMLQNTRTTHSNAIVGFLSWNMSYHAEHHAFTALPFFALPEAHSLLKNQITVQAPSYLSVHRDALSKILKRAPTPQS